MIMHRMTICNKNMCTVGMAIYLLKTVFTCPQVCHSFSPSARYSYSWHPRFGRVRSIVCARDLGEGEEITCDYRYSLRRSPPDWYLRCLRSHLKQQSLGEQVVEDVLREVMGPEGRLNSYLVFPGPDESSGSETSAQI